MCIVSVSKTIYEFIFIAAHAQIHYIISILLTRSSASARNTQARQQSSAAAILDEVSE